MGCGGENEGDGVWRGEVGWIEKTLEYEKLCEWMICVRENALTSRCGGEGWGGRGNFGGRGGEGMGLG